jgi:hypothetical protein
MNIRPLRLLAAVLFAVLAAAMARAHDAQAPGSLASLPQAATAVITGSVDELVIDDRVNGTLLLLHALRQDDGSVVPLSGAGAETLQKGTRVEVTGTLRGAALEVTAYSVLSAAPLVDKAALAAVETQVPGKLVVWHKDYFAEGRGEYGFGVYTDAAQMMPLNVAAASPGVLRPGMTVNASGTTAADGVTLNTNQITILAMPSATLAQVAGATTTNNVLVLPIKFSDSPATDPFTPAQIDQVMRTNTLSTTAYYNEVSYGKQALNVTVACQTTKPAGCVAPNVSPGGWLQTSSATPAGCDYTTMGNLADAAATAAGYNIANYNNRFYVLPGGGGCGWAGLAYVGWPYQAWSAGYNALWVYGHELGHNFTLYHAGSVSCGSLVLSVGCTVAEYGDRFDVMGNNTNTGEQMHFNATQKALLGWIPPSAVMTQTSGTQTYNLSPLEAGGQSIYAVKIPVAADTNRTYWIEYRQPIGLFDATLSSYPNQGAIIHVAEPFDNPCTGSCFADDTEILDMSPANGDNFFDAALLVGQTYTDSTYGVTIKVNSASASALNVTVSVAGAAATTTTLASSANPSTVGASVTFTASVSGSNPTGNVNFTDGEASISGCSAVSLTGSGNTRSAQCSTSALTQSTHSIVASYGGDSGNAASASTALSQVVNASGGSGGSIDVALATNGGVASASSTYVAAGYSFPVSAIIDGDRTGANWGHGGGWNDSTLNVWPDWVQINFSGAQTIDQVIVYTLQDNFTNPVDPPDTLTFTLYGVTAFQVQGWNGSSWVNLGAAVTGNNLVKRAVNFPAFTTTQIRVNITAALNGYSRLTEVEAWTGTGSGSLPSATTLSSSQNPANLSQSVTFTATVTGTNPSGSVGFTSGGGTISGCAAVALTGSGNSKTARCATSFSAAATYTIGASYSGDGSNAPSTAATFSELVRNRH